MHHTCSLHTHTLRLHIIIIVFMLTIFPPVSMSLLAQQEESTESTLKTAEQDSGETGSENAASASTAGETDVDATGEAAPAELPDYEYEDPEFNENRISYPMMILRTVAVMGVIIIGVYFLFRVLVKKKTKLVTDSEVITVLATYPLAANRIIQVVDIGGQVLVLGVSDSSINLITELKDKEAIDRIRLASSKEQGGSGTFKDTFMNLLGGKPFSKPGQISHLSGYQKRINRMKKM